jgi:hypothetical protein
MDNPKECSGGRIRDATWYAMDRLPVLVRLGAGPGDLAEMCIGAYITCSPYARQYDGKIKS